jgi:methionine-rich copper-binding protein CopC
VDVPLNATLVVTFSEAMDTTTVTWNITPDHMLDGTWSAGDTVLTLTHMEDFHQCMLHTVLIAGEDLAGLSLLPGPAPNPFDFTTECTIPYIVDTNPFNMETNVAVTDPIFVNFSEPMDTPTVTWTITPFLTLTGSWFNGNMLLRLDHAALATCTVYTVEIPTGKDPDGNDLFPGQHETHAPNPWQFATTCPNPFLVFTVPADGDTGVSQTLDIMIQFSEPMNTASVTWNIVPFIPLTGSWTGMNQILTLSHPGFPFLCGPNVVTITGNDVGGNPLVPGLVPNPFTFTPVCPNPFIAATVPADTSTAVPLGAVIDITFSEPMNTSSVSWFIAPNITVTFSWSANNTKLRLTPTAPLAPNTQYTVSIVTGQDVDGNDLVPGPAPNPWRFTTAGINPFIVSTDPIDGATGVSTTANVVIVFSEPMDTGSVTAAPAPFIGLIYSWSPDNITLTLVHLAPFVDCVTYRFTVMGQDPTGDPLVPGSVPNPFDFLVFCLRPFVTDTNPADAATGVPLTFAIWVNFSEPMNQGSVLVTIAPSAGTVTYTWTNGNQTLKVTHSADFAECTLYTATVAGNDVDGNSLTAGPVPNPFSFRAACTPPVILSTVPIDGAQGVDPAAAIVITFSRAMDRLTVVPGIVPGSSLLPGWTVGDTVLTLTPSPNLADCTVYTVTITGQDTNGNSLVPGPVPNPFDFETACPIGPPPNLRIASQAPSSIRLTWNAVPLADRYRVYESGNRFASFPSGWNLLDEPTSPSYDAVGHLTDGQPHNYLVRSVRATTESENSSMAAKILKAFGFNPASTNVHWFSLPYRSQYVRASDIANELGPGKIDVIAKWDRAAQTSIPYFWFRGAWRGTDFTINAGDGLWLGAVSTFSWVIFGTDPATTLSLTFHTPPLGNVNWVSVPLTGTYGRAADFVVQIEGNTGGGANTKITDVVRWNGATQSYERFYWTSGGWTGNNFVLAAGDAVYFQIVSSFNWTPSLVTPEVP